MPYSFKRDLCQSSKRIGRGFRYDGGYFMIDLATINTKRNHLETLAKEDGDILEFCLTEEDNWGIANTIGWLGVLSGIIGVVSMSFLSIWPWVLQGLIGIFLFGVSMAHKTNILGRIEKKYGEVVAGGSPPSLLLAGDEVTAENVGRSRL